MTQETCLQLDLYRTDCWVFDDATLGIVAEPFVCGMSEMIDRAIEDFLGEPCETVRVTFSPENFPGSHECITWLHAEGGGNWYRNDRTREQGWLCPVLYRYFPEAPVHLFVAVEKLS